jgi:hypothetical protein
VFEGDALILTLAASKGFTVIVIADAVAVVVMAHGSLDVIITVIISPFSSEEELNTGEFVPTFSPLRFH